jgi:pimeloyl-ACP methyl ester carboxylesterase
MEYRRVGHPGGGWPGTYQDLSAGTDYVRTLASEFPVDTSRVVVVGHSSGGYFAGWVAGRRNLPRDSPLREGPSLAVSGIVVADAFMDPFVIGSKGVNGAYYCGSPMLEVLVGGDPRVEAEQF